MHRNCQQRQPGLPGYAYVLMGVLRAMADDYGDLVFLDQARRQATSRRLRVEDGWTYFLYGWTQVIAEVFDLAIPTSGPGFEAIAAIAARATGRG